MIWKSDYDFDDLGIDGKGIVSMYDCPNCSTSIEVYMQESEE